MRRVVAIASLATACVSCGSLPGSTYAVTGELESNSCGTGQMAPNPWQFTVQVSEQNQTLSWNWLDDSPVLSAPLSTSATANLTATQTENVDAMADGGLGPCTLERDDAIDLTLAPGASPPTFSGTINYAFSVVSGSNCNDQLSSGGGTYQVLPCAISYSITASRQ